MYAVERKPSDQSWCLGGADCNRLHRFSFSFFFGERGGGEAKRASVAKGAWRRADRGRRYNDLKKSSSSSTTLLLFATVPPASELPPSWTASPPSSHGPVPPAPPRPGRHMSRRTMPGAPPLPTPQARAHARLRTLRRWRGREHRKVCRRDHVVEPRGGVIGRCQPRPGRVQIIQVCQRARPYAPYGTAWRLSAHQWCKATA